MIYLYVNHICIPVYTNINVITPIIVQLVEKDISFLNKKLFKYHSYSALLSSWSNKN